MTQRQDADAAARKAGWKADGPGAYVLAGDGGAEQVAQLHYDGSGVITGFVVDDRVLGDEQTVGLADHVVAFFSGRALPARADADAVWDEATGGPAGGGVAGDAPARPKAPARPRAARGKAAGR